jgi:glycogen synthase
MKTLSAEALVNAVKQAVDVFKDRKTNGAWQQIVQTGMNGDYSWDNAGKQYVDMYRKLLKEVE